MDFKEEGSHSLKENILGFDQKLESTEKEQEGKDFNENGD